MIEVRKDPINLGSGAIRHKPLLSEFRLVAVPPSLVLWGFFIAVVLQTILSVALDGRGQTK